MNGWITDLKYVVRGLVRHPAVLLTAVLTLAIGIAANTAIFSVVNTVLLKPLPYPESERLVLLWGEMTRRNVTHFPDSPPNLEDYRTRTTLFEGIAGVNTFEQAFISADGEPVQINVGGGTWNLMDVIGVAPAMGRPFDESDAVFNPSEVPPNAQFPLNTFLPSNTVILSHAFWLSHFGGDPDVLGTIVQLGGSPAEIIGVMPQGFRLFLPPTANADTNIDAWTALRVDLETAPRNNVFLIEVGRLKPGVSLAQAQSDVDQVSQYIESLSSVLQTAGYRKRVVSFEADLTAHARAVLWTLLGAAVFVLLIACANVANLLLVRASERSRETAIKLAIGGSQGRVIRQMLIEGAILTFLAAVVGVAFVHVGLQVILRAAPQSVARLDSAAVDPGVLGFTLGLVVIATALASLFPALLSSRPDIAQQLRSRSGGGIGPRDSRFRSGMVVLAVGLSFVLLVGTGMMVKSFVQLNKVDLGFNPEQVLTFRLNLPATRYADADSISQFNLQLQESIGNLPGARDVSAIFPMPLGGRAFNGRYVPGNAVNDEADYRQANYRTVLPDYFKTTQGQLISGRAVSEDDEINARPVVVVNDILAAEAWPGRDPVGEFMMLRLGAPEPIPVEVIGVVKHQIHTSLNEAGRATVYMPSKLPGLFGGVGDWLIKTDGSPLRLVGAVREAVRALDAELPISRVRMFSDYVEDAKTPTRFALMLIVSFGISALLLAAIGLYAVIAYVVRIRRPEIAVRMSFGAQNNRIFSLFLRQGMFLALIGLSVGVMAAVALGQTLSSVVAGVSWADLTTYLWVMAGFLVVCLVSCLVPAWQATRVDPMYVLREE